MKKEVFEKYMESKGKSNYSENIPKLLKSLGINQYIVLDTIYRLNIHKKVIGQVIVQTTQIRGYLRKKKVKLTNKQINTALNSLCENNVIKKPKNSRNKWVVKNNIFDAIYRLNSIQEEFENFFDHQLFPPIIKNIELNLDSIDFFSMEMLSELQEELKELGFEPSSIEEKQFEFIYKHLQNYCNIEIIFGAKNKNTITLKIKTTVTNTNLNNFKNYLTAIYQQKEKCLLEFISNDKKKTIKKWVNSSVDGVLLILLNKLDSLFETKIIVPETIKKKDNIIDYISS